MNIKLLPILGIFLLVAGSALAVPCEEPDNGSNTIDLPPTCPAGYVGSMQIVDGLPAGSTIEIDAAIVCFPGIEVPGGTLGGHQQTFDAQIVTDMVGTGALAGFNRHIIVPLFACVTESAPRTPGDPVQSFPQQWVSLSGELFGDPDFCTLLFKTGSDFGLASAGSTILTDIGGGLYNVDSFFDVHYQIEFQGCPGSVLQGMSGTTDSVEVFQLGEEAVVSSEDAAWGSVKALFRTE